MPRRGGLRDVQGSDQVADAQRFIEEKAKDANTGEVGEGAEGELYRWSGLHMALSRYAAKRMY